jgi:hypothetical protein
MPSGCEDIPAVHCLDDPIFAASFAHDFDGKRWAAKVSSAGYHCPVSKLKGLIATEPMSSIAPICSFIEGR